MTTTTTSQGTLHLDCIASDPSSSYLYGIASANTGTSSYTTDSTIVLVRSNYNPTSLATITWTIISTTEGKQFSYNYMTFTSVDCAANDKGHFAAFFRSPYRTASPFRLLPMGVRYDPTAKEKGEGAWSPIWGSVMYGWNVDRFVHRSFYQGDELVHLLTGDVVDSLQLGRVDYATNMLQLGSIQTRQQVDVFLLSYTFDNMVWIQDFDYTQKGFFPDYTGFFPQKVALHNGTFYITNSEDQNVTYVYQGVGRRIEEVRGGLYSKTEWALGDYHVFAGLRQGLTFFGGIYKEDYRDGFTVFGPSAGAMLGSFQVMVPASTAEGVYFNSLPQRIVTKMNTPRWTDKDALADERNMRRDSIVGGSVSAVVVIAFLGYLVWRKWAFRKRRQIRKKEEAEMAAAMAAMMLGGGAAPFSPVQNPTAPPLVLSEKHEVYSSGKILEEIKELEDEEEDSSSDDMPNSAGRSSGRMKRSARHSGSVSKRPGMLADAGRLPSYTYQDQIEELDFSSHPRPNIVTTVGDQNTK
ncbi:hypothetical protein BGX30_014400 [Mortierella sp. GBA39]|nr:hypothetical protein BGX30_014400 [Mortierella sp. GBA39]